MANANDSEMIGLSRDGFSRKDPDALIGGFFPAWYFFNC